MQCTRTQSTTEYNAGQDQKTASWYSQNKARVRDVLLQLLYDICEAVNY